MSLDCPKLKICAAKCQKKVWECGSRNKSKITVLSSYSVTGHILPPFIIFEGKKCNLSLTWSEVPGTLCGTSLKGWIDTELFQRWFCDNFLQHATAACPQLLLMDDHSSHYQPEHIRFARDSKGVILCLPPHTSADSQLLDVEFFTSLNLTGVKCVTSGWINTQVIHRPFNTWVTPIFMKNLIMLYKFISF